MLHFPSIHKKWTLFLDRDGVINQRLPNAYVQHYSAFVFLPQVPQAIALLNRFFGKCIVVTNQQGIGKKLMTEEDLMLINQKMREDLQKHNATIDAVYFAPDLANSHSLMRKPQIGMALQAKKDFPDINFAQSIMVGDSLSDLQFARNAGMYSVWINEDVLATSPLADKVFSSLMAFAEWLKGDSHNCW
ncbi:MAG: HAD-IIIA family hydrolase [Chitinophagales bacterium]|nr:HAD-IIIA family hydrolase [Bacteroidota bacterium]MCB9043531.1 HAD-IIIA family hydrolase [Chitinophagales bacterium]